MKEITQKTFDYEEEILQNIDESKVLPDVIKVKKYGSCYKKQGIPFIFQILTLRKHRKKIKIFKLFGIKVYTRIKQNF